MQSILKSQDNGSQSNARSRARLLSRQKPSSSGGVGSRSRMSAGGVVYQGDGNKFKQRNLTGNLSMPVSLMDMDGDDEYRQGQAGNFVADDIRLKTYFEGDNNQRAKDTFYYIESILPHSP